MRRKLATDRHRQTQTEAILDRGGNLSATWGVWTVVAGLLGVLAIRMCLTETVRTSVTMLAQERMPGAAVGPSPGPATTLGLCVLTLGLAGIAAWARPMTRWAWGSLVVIAAIGVCLAVSTLRAEARFVALVGSADVMMALLGGWTMSLVAGSGKARRWVVAVLVAILTAWAARAMVQYFIEFPEMIAWVKENPEEALKSQGIKKGSPGEDLFMHRMNSREVWGFVTYSNVFANGLVGLCTVAAGLAAAGVVFKRAERTQVVEEQKKRRREVAEARTEIPIWPMALGGTVLAAAAGIVVLVFTASKGGCAAAIIGWETVVVGIAARELVARRRWMILAVLAVAAVGVAAGGVWYGVRHDRLPTKSLMFRWHYWTATASLVKERPWAGVGMNNFGDYYTAVKRASSPEDVKDPHSFFVRWAAEAGLPAAGLVGGLIVIYVLAAVRRRGEEGDEAEGSMGGEVLAGAAFCAAWWVARFFLSENQTTLDALMAVVYAGVAFGGLVAALALQREMSRGAGRALAAGLLVGALGMLVYDQVNMALVTGQVAMAFWMMLGAAGAEEKAGRGGGKIVGAVLGVGALALAVVVWAPVAAGKFAWDPRGAQERYVDASLAEDFGGALAAIDRAVELSPRSMDFLQARIETRRRLGLPIAADIRRVMTLDRGNARVRMELAMRESDLPAAERAGMLAEALRLDAALPREEAKVLSAEEVGTVKKKIGELKGKF